MGLFLKKNNIQNKFLSFKKYHFPYFYYKYLYKEIMGKKKLFSTPNDLNEIIQWLEFHTDTTAWTRLADKYRVREYVEDKIGSQYLIPLLGKWEKPEDIDFNMLPNSFVIKPNNGSGDCIIVKDRNLEDLEKIRQKLKHSMSQKSMYNGAERHYYKIEPCVIAEELLEVNNIVDYKIWCFNGTPNHFLVCTNRNQLSHHANLNYYDLEWKRRPEKISIQFQNDDVIPKPKNIEEMLLCARKLSEGFPQVRVDLYNIDGKIYFGELTFTSAFGFMNYYTQESLSEMGALVTIPKRTLRDYYVSFRNRYIPTFD